MFIRHPLCARLGARSWEHGGTGSAALTHCKVIDKSEGRLNTASDEGYARGCRDTEEGPQHRIRRGTREGFWEDATSEMRPASEK